MSVISGATEPSGPTAVPKEAAMSFWDVFVSIFWFMILVAWFWLIISVITDLFRDHTISGGAKALWCLFIILIPWLGVLVYMIARGGSMRERAEATARRNDAAFQDYVRHAAGTPSTADELAKLADLRDRGAISAEDYERAKEKVLAHDGPAPNPATGQTDAVPARPLP
jgi:Short C-terminal domain/Phospholipase_D-nuclease N-terminal